MKNLIAVGMLALAAAGAVQAQTKSAANAVAVPNNLPPPPARGPAADLALEAAQVAIETCKAKGFNVAVTIVDSAGVQKVLLAADGVHARGVQSSTNKAVTALTFKASTSRIAESIKADQELAAQIAANPSFAPRAGGVLLQVGSEIIGAIGVGGARGSEHDQACALAAIEKVRHRLR
jgi:uncharacterized protein GlcG (DUF336 family)